MIHTIPSPDPDRTIRDIMDCIKYRPPEGDHVTILIVTDWSRLSEGCLLALAKALEEPPEHLIIVNGLGGPELTLEAVQAHIKERKG